LVFSTPVAQKKAEVCYLGQERKLAKLTWMTMTIGTLIVPQPVKVDAGGPAFACHSI